MSTIQVLCHDGAIRECTVNTTDILDQAIQLYDSATATQQQQYTVSDYEQVLRCAMVAVVAGSEWRPRMLGLQWHSTDDTEAQLRQRIMALPTDMQHEILVRTQRATLEAVLQSSATLQRHVPWLLRHAHLAPVSVAQWACDHWRDDEAYYTAVFQRAMHHIDHQKYLSAIDATDTPFLEWYLVEAKIRIPHYQYGNQLQKVATLDELKKYMVTADVAQQLASQYHGSVNMIETTAGCIVLSVESKAKYTDRVLGNVVDSRITMEQILSAWLQATSVQLHPQQSNMAEVLRYCAVRHDTMDTLQRHITLVQQLVAQRHCE